MRKGIVLGAAVALTAAACTDPSENNFGEQETDGQGSCDNLDQTHCVFPFPSDYFRTVDDGKARLNFGDDVLPAINQTPLSPEYFNEEDGFPTIPPIYFTLEGATLAGAPAHDAIDLSLSKSAKTIVLDADTGAFVPHFAEFDWFGVRGGAERKPVEVVALRLAKGLEYDRRYIVAVQGLVDAEGAPVEASPGFAPLRDKTVSKLRGVHGRRAHYEKEIFPVLEKAGVARKDLQLAWDFTVASEKGSTQAMVSMQQKLYELIGEDGPEYTITRVDTDVDQYIKYMLTGVAKVPSFIDGKEGEIRRIRRDAAGNAVAEGFEDVEFQIQIPRRLVETDGAKWPVLQYGHGLLGRKNQATRGWLRKQANDYGYVVVAIDLQGMSESDSETTWNDVLLGQQEKIPLLAEKPHQGTINTLAIARMMKGRFAKDTDPRYTREGVSYVDPSTVWYYGNSQGGTQGTPVMALHRDVTRGILGVPGCAYAYLLTRAFLFSNEFMPAIELALPDPVDQIVLMGLVQIGFNKLEPLNYAARMTDNPFPDTPPHQVLLQVGAEDSQVHNELSWLLGRTVKAKQIMPAPYAVWGFDHVTEPFQGNGLAFWDLGRRSCDDFPNEAGCWKPHAPNEPAPEEYDPHGWLRSVDSAQKQFDHFLRTGEVKNFCEHGCGPEDKVMIEP